MSKMDDVKRDMKRVHVAYAPTEDDADKMIKALEEAGVNAKKGDGIRDLYAIGDPVGIEILVFPADLDRAVEVVRKVAGSSAVSDQAPGSGKNALTWVIVCVIVLVLLFCIRAFLLRQ